MLTQEQEIYLNKHVDGGNWTLKNDGVVDIDDNINIGWSQLTKLPSIKFGKVQGFFNCTTNELTSLKGCPSDVLGFDCTFNKLTSLEYAPTKIGDKIYCSNNPFILNDKLFTYLASIGGKTKIGDLDILMIQLKDQVSIQFSLTDQFVIDEIWNSYMKILDNY